MDPNAFKSKKLLSSALFKQPPPSTGSSVAVSNDLPSRKQSMQPILKPLTSENDQMRNQLPPLNGLKSQINLQNGIKSQTNFQNNKLNVNYFSY